MKLSAKQAYVLANLHRVRPLGWKLAVRDPLPRYQLDGWECTAQVTGLVVRGHVKETDDGALVLLTEAEGIARDVPRQAVAVAARAGRPPRLAYAATDLRGRFIGVDESFSALLGCVPGNLFGLSILDVTHEDHRPSNRVLLDRLIETGEPFEIRKRYRRRGAAPVWVENHVSRLIEENNEPRLVASVRLVEGPEPDVVD